MAAFEDTDKADMAADTGMDMAAADTEDMVDFDHSQDFAGMDMEVADMAADTDMAAAAAYKDYSTVAADLHYIDID